MRTFLVGSLLLVGLAALLPAGPSSPADALAAPVLATEGDRVRAHLTAVENYLRSVDASHLPVDRRRARAGAIDHLRAYREAGVFPHNHHHRERTPLFRDAHGSICALGYLIERSGATSLVDRVVRTANRAWVRDLAGDPDLIAWLDRNGMTIAEAALVQVPGYEPVPLPDGEGASSLLRDYAVVGGVLLAADAAALYLLDRPGMVRSGSAREIVGVGVGLASAGSAVAALTAGIQGPGQGLALANLGFGLVAAAVGAHGLIAGHAGSGRQAYELPGGAELVAGPRLIPSADYRPGLGLTMHF